MAFTTYPTIDSYDIDVQPDIVGLILVFIHLKTYTCRKNQLLGSLRYDQNHISHKSPKLMMVKRDVDTLYSKIWTEKLKL